MGKNPIISDYSPFIRDLTTTGSPAAGPGVHVGRELESRTSGGTYIIYHNRFYPIKKGFIHHVGNFSVGEHLVIVMRLIQSQTQRGPRSATLVHHHPDGKVCLFVLQVIFYHFTCLF